MPAVNPRITITLRPGVHAVLRRMSELTGESQSAIVAELLDKSSPVFERMVRVLEAAERLRAEGKALGEEFTAGLDQAHQHIEQQLGIVFETLETREGALLEAAESIGRRRRRAGDAAERQPPAGDASVRAPMSNRGVTPRGNPKKKASKPAAARKGATRRGRS